MPLDVAALKAQFPILAEPSLHYLDNAATAQVPEAVLDSLRRFETSQRANVHGGVHRLARAALEAYEGARAAMARYLNVASEEVVFTYGATSALNLLATTFGQGLEAGDEVVLSILEHHSNLLPWQRLAHERGVVLRVVGATPDGRLDLTDLARKLGPRCKLVALTHCSNVTGAVTPVAPVVKAARAVGAKVLLDGAQRAPHGPLDLPALGIDFYALSGHKMYGPTGIGVLWGRAELLEALPPYMVGGQMIERVSLEGATFARPPRRFEAGTPPIAAAVGLGAAADWLLGLPWPEIAAEELRLTGRILAGLADLPGIRVFGPEGTQDRRGVVSFLHERLSVQEICRKLDGDGLALRCGYHCAQPLLEAFGLPGTARASLGLYNDDQDVDALLSGLAALSEQRA